MLCRHCWFGFQYVHAVPITCISYCTFKYFEFFEYRVSHGIQISFIQRSTATYICKVYIVLCSKSINVLGLVYNIVGSTSLLRNLLSEAVGSIPAEKSKT